MLDTKREDIVAQPSIEKITRTLFVTLYYFNIFYSSLTFVIQEKKVFGRFSLKPFSKFDVCDLF